MQSKASVVTLTMFDIRSGVQLSISKATRRRRTSARHWVHLAAVRRAALAASRTPEGKATVAAFMDAYNNMVVSLRNYKAQEVKGGLGRGGQLKVGS
jgi:hypothetical protein